MHALVLQTSESLQTTSLAMHVDMWYILTMGTIMKREVLIYIRDMHAVNLARQTTLIHRIHDMHVQGWHAVMTINGY